MKIKTKLKRYLSTLKKELGCAVSDESYLDLENAINNYIENEESLQLDKSSFEIPKEILGNPNAVAIFSDGACRGNPGPGAWGTVAQDHNGSVLFELSEVDQLTTNNKMELKGALEGMVYLESILRKNSKCSSTVELHVFTDSQYLVNGMNSWVEGWKRRGWKKADKKVPENVEIWQKLDALKSLYKSVRFHWVKGHAGHPQNEFCDQLANKALNNEGY